MQIDDHTLELMRKARAWDMAKPLIEALAQFEHSRVPIYDCTREHHDAFFWAIKRVALHHSPRDAAAVDGWQPE